MGPVGWSDAAGGHVERCGAPGLVSRPRLFERLAAPARVTVVSAPPGSGKTVLLRSWISEAGLADSTAWMPVGRGVRDPQQFWLSVLSALRQTAPGSVLVQQLTAAPDLNGWAIVERLLTDLAPLHYHGGPVIAGEMQVYAIFWEPRGSFVSSKFNMLLKRYFRDVGVNIQPIHVR